MSHVRAQSTLLKAENYFWIESERYRGRTGRIDEAKGGHKVVTTLLLSLRIQEGTMGKGNRVASRGGHNHRHQPSRKQDFRSIPNAIKFC